MRPRTAAPPPILRTTLQTERLLLRASDPALAGAVAAYLKLNRAAHAPWSPPMRDAVFTVAGQRERLAASAKAEGEGTQIGWFLSPIDDEQRVIGHLRFSQIARGPFCNAMLGYAIGSEHQGRGLMREALAAAIADVFGPRVGLHRVQANARPENARSLALLERLGFEREGLARRYLFIDGAWRDHVLTALVNPSWAVDRSP